MKASNSNPADILKYEYCFPGKESQTGFQINKNNR